MILVLLAAAAQAAAQPLPAPPLAVSPPSDEGRPHRAPRRQLFVAPSGEPFRAAPEAPYPVADWFARANSTHDGKLTEAQFTADFARFAATLDLNHDGVIDGAELQNYETNVLPEVHSPDFSGGRGGGMDGGGDQGGGAGGHGSGGHGHHRGGNWGGGGGGSAGAEQPQGAGRFGLLTLPEPVAAMDTDLNGRISRQEVLAAAAYRFAQLDTAQHGYLTLGDLPKTWAQSRREMFRKRRDQGGGNFAPRGGMGGAGAFGGGMSGGEDRPGDPDQGN